MIQGKTLDIKNFRSNQVQSKYPCMVLKGLNDSTPLVVGMLENGEIPLIAEYNGARKVICNVSDSAYNVDKLIRTHEGLEYHISEAEVRTITSVREYLEVITGWIC